MKMDYQSKCILVKDALHNLRNRCHDKQEDMTNCFVCGALCKEREVMVKVQGELVRHPEHICERCDVDLSYEIEDLEMKIEETGSTY